MSEHEEHGPRGPGGPGAPWRGRNPAQRGLRIAGIAVAAVVGTAVFALAFGWLVMILWNWLMPMIFHLGTLNYWQSFGIVILAKLVFGGIAGPRRGPGRNPWGGNPWGGNPWQHRHDWRRGRDDWRWYREFWEQEGKPAFERFMEKKRAEQASGAEGSGSGPSPQGV